MANVTIIKTNSGHCKIDFGDYFPSSTLEKTHYFPFNSWLGVCTLRIDTEDGVEVHVSHESESFKLSYNSGLTNFMKVDSVNGEIPTDNDHLIELLTDLL